MSITSEEGSSGGEFWVGSDMFCGVVEIWKFLSVQLFISSTAWHSKIIVLVLILTRFTDTSRPVSVLTILLWIVFHNWGALYKNELVFLGT